MSKETEELGRLNRIIRQVEFIARGRDENDDTPHGITTDWRRILNLTRQAVNAGDGGDEGEGE